MKKRGRHVQIGLAVGEHQNMNIPMNRVIGRELVLLGSHGMPARAYPTMMEKIQQGELEPQRLITKTVKLEESIQVLMDMANFQTQGVVVIDRF